MPSQLERLTTLVDESAEELIQLHRDLVRIPTVNSGKADSGNESDVCRALQARLSAEQIDSRTYESRPERGNLLASIGPAGGERLLFMSHTDVVPVEDESAWSHPPFGAVVENGRVYGRGSEDAKSLVSSGLMSLILLKRAGIALNGEVSFLAAADEEAGGNYGIAWLAKNHPDELRATWALNEGGGMPVRRQDRLGYLLACGEKGRLEAHFTCAGSSGHAARPWSAENALHKMAGLLQRIAAYQPQIDASQPVFDYLDWFGLPADAAGDAANSDAANSDFDRRLEQADLEPAKLYMLKALSRMTVTPTLASAGIKSNSIPASSQLTCDIRTLPSQDEAYVRRQLDSIVGDMPGVSYELQRTAEANSSSFDSPFIAALQEATNISLGDRQATLVPTLSVGFTDSRHVRPLGAEVYGYSPLAPNDHPLSRGVHGVDEFTDIESLILRTKLKVILAYLLLAA